MSSQKIDNNLNSHLLDDSSVKNPDDLTKDALDLDVVTRKATKNFETDILDIPGETYGLWEEEEIGNFGIVDASLIGANDY